MRDTNETTMVTDADGVILYDASDDSDESPVVGLKDNREIFTQEYMEAFEVEADAKNVKLKRNDRLVSVGVVLSIVAFTATLMLIFL